MSQTARRHRIEQAILGEPYFPPVSLPVDVTDAEAFPNIAEAIAHLASLSPEERARLNEGWN